MVHFKRSRCYQVCIVPQHPIETLEFDFSHMCSLTGPAAEAQKNFWAILWHSSAFGELTGVKVIASTMTNVREKQAAAIRHMLAFNSKEAPTSAAPGDFADQWKVLVYDDVGRDIISPLLNIGQLRQCGVTLHMLVRISFILHPKGSFRCRG